MHRLRITAFHKVWLVSVAAEQMIELLVTDTREHAGVRDLVAVQVQDGQHHTISQRIQELVGVPARGERASLRFAIANDAGHDQVRVVERSAECMGQRISQLATFMDRPGSFWRHVTGNAARERELLEQPLHALLVPSDVRIDLAISAIEPRIGHQAGAAMTRTSDIEHAQIALLDDAIEMRVDEVQARRRTPVAQQSRLDVLAQQRLGEQRIVI